jgi:hypothetical protein
MDRSGLASRAGYVPDQAMPAGHNYKWASRCKRWQAWEALAQRVSAVIHAYGMARSTDRNLFHPVG